MEMITSSLSLFFFRLRFKENSHERLRKQAVALSLEMYVDNCL